MGDEVNLIGPTLALSGTWQDFTNSIRAIPFGVPDPHEVIGVLYLRLFRGVLEIFGPTITGLRFPSLAGGVLSLVTGTLLGRALLPRGGGALAAAVLAPLFLLPAGPASGSLARTARHNVFLEMRYTKSLLPPFAVAADSLAAPWFLPESAGWIDLPGRSRLGWVIGVPVALALARALAFPREELSLLLLLQAGAALAAAVLGGQAG